jgi:hypothetical protein
MERDTDANWVGAFWKSLANQVAFPVQRLGAPELVTVAAPAKAG